MVINLCVSDSIYQAFIVSYNLKTDHQILIFTQMYIFEK